MTQQINKVGDIVKVRIDADNHTTGTVVTVRPSIDRDDGTADRTFSDVMITGTADFVVLTQIHRNDDD